MRRTGTPLTRIAVTVPLRAMPIVRYAKSTPARKPGSQSYGSPGIPPAADSRVPVTADGVIARFFLGQGKALGKGSALGGGSATAERVDHFHLVPFAERMGGVLAARDDGAVDLDRDAAVGQAFPTEQIGDGGGRCEGARGTVEQDVHGAIVARDESRGTAPYV